jgi:ABC-type transport system involved in cytochrome c biogenesis permease subunit
MAIGTYAALYAATAFYVLGAILSLLYLRGKEPRLLAFSSYALMAGIVAFLCVFVLRWLVWKHLPLTTMTDSLNLFAVLAGLAVLFTVRKDKVPALLCFCLPPLAVIAVVNALAAYRFLPVEPRALRSSFLSIHVGLAILAYAFFFIAGMTSAAYLFQARHLKRHHTSDLFRHLPSLAELDTTVFRLIAYGYPLFIITLTLGLIWAFIDRDQLGSYWWLSPKVVLSYVMAAFYAGTFHLRRLGRLRGPKLAQLVCAGFFLLIVSYIVLSIVGLRGYHFWSKAS